MMEMKRLLITVMVLALLTAASMVSGAEQMEKMTYEQAVQRIPRRDLPKWWLGDVKGLAGRLEKLTRGKVRVIAISPGGRPIHLVTFGEREKLKHSANFNSAIGAREPSAYMDKAARKKPVVYFVGPVHGHEIEPLTGLVNFINVMETGQDLRGRDQSQLRSLGEKCRLLIIPAANPDGIERFEPRTLQGMGFWDLRFWGQGTWSDDTFCGYPQGKRQHPMAGDNVGFLGGYFNDAGINIMHDEFLDPMADETRAILRVAKEEGPDLAVSLHSFDLPSPAILRPAYLTTEIQQEVRELADAYYPLLDKRGLPHWPSSSIQPKAEGGERPAAFNLVSAIYHISGATAFTHESPHGLSIDNKPPHATLEQILDIELTLYEAMMRHALKKKGQ